ncbi:phosphotransferase [Paenibacillus sp. FSL R7-0297]|uniref:phosphotransferase enzyme family protein n=1 Tax=unclassified Paenibacillus TaxID=185978 RepID=UPI0030FBCF19
MLKLEYLHNNEELASMLLGNWEFDPESLHLFQYYRISSNAVYPFENAGENQLLRFAPAAEKRKDNVRAELEFIAYLRECGYGVLEAVASNTGEKLVEADTPWGAYYASVFKRVGGVQLGSTELSDHILYKYGEALGQLHQLSSEYTPVEAARWSHKDVLEWMLSVLAEFPWEEAAVAEARLLIEYFSGQPVTTKNYGLTHYDFELDNVFYDEGTDTISAIDFDDAMYHWYAADIEQALDSLRGEVAPETYEHQKQCFMDGYAGWYNLPQEGPSMAACRRFADLYGYVRILRSAAEQSEHEPEWLITLRSRLAGACAAKASRFSGPIR